MLSLLSIPLEVLESISYWLNPSDLLTIAQIKELEPIWRNWSILKYSNSSFNSPDSITCHVNNMKYKSKKRKITPQLVLVILDVYDDPFEKFAKHLLGKFPHHLSILAKNEEVLAKFLISLKPLADSKFFNIDSVEIKGSDLYLDYKTIPFYAPEAQYLELYNVEFIKKHNQQVVSPLLEKLKITGLNDPDVLKFPEATTLIRPGENLLTSSRFVDLLEGVETLKIEHLYDSGGLHGLNLSTLVNLTIGVDNVLNISKIKAPMLKDLKILYCEEFLTISDCEFNSLETIEANNCLIGECQRNFAPNFTKLKIKPRHPIIEEINHEGFFDQVKELTTCNDYFISMVNLKKLEFLHICEVENGAVGELSFVKSPSLKTLCLSHVDFDEKLKLNAPNLENLSMVKCNINYDIFNNIPILLPKLKVLKFEGQLYYYNRIEGTIGNLEWKFSNLKLSELETLIIGNKTEIYSRRGIFRTLVTKMGFYNCDFPKLKLFSVDHWSHDFKLINLQIGAPNLKFLKLRNPGTGELDLSHYKHLKALSIEGVSILKYPNCESLEFIGVYASEFKFLHIGELTNLIEGRISLCSKFPKNFNKRKLKGPGDFISETKEVLDANFLRVFFPKMKWLIK